MAGPVFTGTIKIIDQATAPFRKIMAQNQAFMNTMRQAQQLGAQGIQQTRRATQAIQQYNQGLAQTNAQTKATGRTTRDLHITMMGMLRVMALFAINLQLINTITAPYTFIRGAIENGKVFQTSLKQINALLRLSSDGIKALGKDALRLSMATGAPLKDVLGSIQEIASSVSSLNKGGLNDVAATLMIVQEGLKGARITGDSAVDSTNSLRTVMSALNIDVTQANRIMGMLFATVDVGTLKFKDINQQIGDFAGTVQALAPADQEGKLKFLQQTLTLFARLSNAMPAAEAATATNRLLMNSVKEAKKTEQLRKEVTRATGIDLSTNVMTAQGPLAYVNNIAQAIGRDSDLVAKLQAKGKNLENATEAEIKSALTARSAKLAATIAPNVRALRPLLILAADGQDKLKELEAEFADSSQQYNAQALATAQDVTTQWNRMKAIFTSIQVILSDPIMREATTFLRNIADNVSAVVNAAGFDQLSSKDKITRVLNGFNVGLNDWWSTGGKQKVGEFVTNMTAGIIIFLQYGVEQHMDKVIAIGESLAKGIVTGIMGYFSNPKNAVGSPIIQGLLASWLFGVSPVKGIGGALLGQQAFGNLTGTSSGGSGGGIFGGLSGMAMGLAEMAIMAKMFGGGRPGGFFGRGGTVAGTNVPAGAKWNAKAGRWTQNGKFIPTPAPKGGGFFGGAGQVAQQYGIGMGLSGILTALQNPGNLAKVGKSFLTGSAVRLGGLGLGAEMLARGPGPLPDLGGISGVLGTMLGGTTPDSKNKAVESTLSTLNSSQNINDLIAANTNAQLGVTDPKGNTAWKGMYSKLDPLSAVDKVTGFVGGLFGKGGTSLGVNEQQKNINRQKAATLLGTSEGAIAAAYGLQDSLPPGVINEVLRAGRIAGITDPAELNQFLAFNLATMKRESGFNPAAILSNGKERSLGLYQLNKMGGQGNGYSDEDLYNPIKNTQIGAAHLANAWINNRGSSIADIAAASGHPGAGAAGGVLAQSIQADTHAFLARATNDDTFQAVKNSGFSSPLSGGGLAVTVQGDLILNGVNPNDMEAFAKALKKSLNNPQ